VKPMVGYFRVLGCVDHAHVLDQKRRKFDDKSKECVFLGVSDESMAYRLYDPISKKIIISKDVIFQEDEYWNWGKGNEECRSDVLKWNDDDDENNMEKGIENNEEEDNIEEEGSDVDTRNSSETSSFFSESTKDDSPILNEGRVSGPPSWQ